MENNFSKPFNLLKLLKERINDSKKKHKKEGIALAQLEDISEFEFIINFETDVVTDLHLKVWEHIFEFLKEHPELSLVQMNTMTFAILGIRKKEMHIENLLKQNISKYAQAMVLYKQKEQIETNFETETHDIIKTLKEIFNKCIKENNRTLQINDNSQEWTIIDNILFDLFNMHAVPEFVISLLNTYEELEEPLNGIEL